MRNDRGGRSSSNFRGPPDGPRNPSKQDKIRELLKSDARASYITDAAPGPAFLDADARSQAEKFQNIPPSQLRRFYGMVVGFKRRIDLNPENRIGAPDVQAQMAYLKAAAAYAAMRMPERDHPEELLQFFIGPANSVKTPAHFEQFCRHFEAVVAYHKVFGKERRD